MTNYPIKVVNNLEILADVLPLNIVGKDPNDIRINDITIDISDYIVESEIFNNMSYEEKKKHVYYTKGSNFVNLSNSYKGFVFTKYSLANAIRFSLAKTFNNINYIPPIELEVDSIDLVFAIYIADDKDLIQTKLTYSKTNGWSNHWEAKDLENDDDTNNILDIRYRISYIPEYTTRITETKEDSDEANIDTQTIVQQEDRVVSFYNFSNTLYSVAQRQGTKNKSIN